MISLYKKDSKGKIRIWTVGHDGDILFEHSGIHGGKLVKHEKQCKPKHIGKANETSGPQQAESEMNSKIAKKLDSGYFYTVEEAETKVILLPMLAKTYADHSSKVDWETVCVQPKLDGMRCLAKIEVDKVTLLSRKGKEITTMGHIAKVLEPLMEVVKKTTDPIILDGELYTFGDTFQNCMRRIKKYREGESEGIQYNVYDLISPKGFQHRIMEASGYLDQIGANQRNSPIIGVPTQLAKNEASMYEAHSSFTSMGFEGTMVRWSNDGYQLDSRSDALLKLKDFQDLACKIIDIVPSEARPKQGVFVCECEAGKFNAAYAAPVALREELLKDKALYLGQYAEIRFFEYTDGGLPRFPVCHGVRLDK
jgi:ATP-dependent DNA ligase